MNVRIGPYEVDFMWRSHRVIVETDGYEAHGGRAAFRRDKARDARLRVMGYAVQRFAYQHIVEQAGFVAAVVRALARWEPRAVLGWMGARYEDETGRRR